MFDGKAFGEGMVEIVRSYVDRTFGAVDARLKAIEDRAPQPAFDEAALTRIVEATVARAISSMRPPEKGDPGIVDMEAVAELVQANVKAVVADLPPAKKGDPGESVDMDAVSQQIEAMFAAVVEAMPAPEKGAKGDSGVGLADALIDRDGNLVITFTNGETKSLGRIVGKDGDPGKNADAIGLEDIGMELMEDGRTLRIGVSKGDYEYAFQIPFPVVLDRGVWKDAQPYEEGDGVTWGGSFWIAQRATAAGEKPDAPDGGFRLAVKKGRDAK